MPNQNIQQTESKSNGAEAGEGRGSPLPDSEIQYDFTISCFGPLSIVVALTRPAADYANTYLGSSWLGSHFHLGPNHLDARELLADLYSLGFHVRVER